MSQAIKALPAGVRRTACCLWQVVERMKLTRALFLDFEVKQSRHPEKVLREIAYILALGNSFRDPVDGFVRVIFRERTPAPLKEPGQLTARFRINSAGAVPV